MNNKDSQIRLDNIQNMLNNLSAKKRKENCEFKKWMNNLSEKERLEQYNFMKTLGPLGVRTD